MAHLAVEPKPSRPWWMKIQNNLLWAGIEYYSLENCLVSQSEDTVSVNSTIIGFYKGIIYRIDYTIELDSSWHTRSCLIRSQLGQKINEIILARKPDGWYLDRQLCPELKGCTDVDISLTPFTNSLPVNRLQLAEEQEAEIAVIYMDLLGKSISPVKQRYKRLTGDRYHYENILNDFQADILMDGDGFVMEYPELFTRKAASTARD